MSRRKREPEPINDLLKEHSLTTDDWDYQEIIAKFHEWAERFNNEFQLGLQTPAIRIDDISARRLGTYREDRNGFGLKHEVTVNSKYLGRPFADQLMVLLHELLHEWQLLYGTPARNSGNNYHNKQFRNKAMLYGLIVDQRGCSGGVHAGRFTALLSRYGVSTESLPRRNP